MPEGHPSDYEVGREKIPSFEEVRSLIIEIVGEKELQEVKRKEDEKGLYFLELVTTEADGTITEYIYTRAGENKEGKAQNGVINLVFYNADNIPVSGYNLADFIDGKWKVNS